MLRLLRTTVRSLLRRPAFTATVVVTLALGLGASAAIFNIVDAVLLRSLPFPQPERLVLLWETVTRDTVERRTFSYPDFADLRNQTGSFERLAAYDQAFFTVRGEQRAERITGAIVSHDYWSVLRVAPSLGTGFDEQPMSTNTSQGGSVEPHVVLSHGFWQSRFAGERDVLGRTLDLDDRRYTVVGVMPESNVSLVDQSQLWISFEELPTRILESRTSRWHSVVGRLRDGVTEQQAREELAVVFSRLEEQYPASNQHYGADLGSLQSQLFGDLRAPLLTLLTAVGLVLLVACANVAGLLLVHNARRAPETALRRALGASTRRLLTSRGLETTILGLTGGAFGLGLATLLTRVLVRLSPIELPSFVELGLGGRVLTFAALLSMVVGVLLALGSALVRGNEADTANTLRSGTSRLSARQPGLTALLVTEVALATVLAVGAGLLLVSFGKLMKVEPGFEPERLLFARVDLPSDNPGEGNSNDANGENANREDAGRGRAAALRSRLLDTATGLPSVRTVALASDSPLDEGYSATILSREGGTRQTDEPYEGGVRVYRHLVTPGYFTTVGVSLERGRGFELTDQGDSEGVAIVSRKLAERMWPGEEPLGQRFKFGRPLGPDQDASEVEWVTVVGVVANHRFRSLIPDADGAPEDPDVYFSLEQFDPGSVVVIAATEGDPTPVIAPLRAGIEGLSPELALYGVETIGERLYRETARPRFASSLIAAFAGVTLFLAALGIWGLVAYQVAARLRDIGVRLALGAGREQVIRQVVVGAGKWLVVGLTLGLAAAVFATRWLESQLFGVVPREPRVYLFAAVVLLLTGLLAALLPALRAGRVNPVEVLRSEG